MPASDHHRRRRRRRARSHAGLGLGPAAACCTFLGWVVLCCSGFRPPSSLSSQPGALPRAARHPLPRLHSLDEKAIAPSISNDVVTRPRAQGSSGVLRLKELLQRRLLFVVEAVGDIDRAALYLTRQDLVGKGVELIPGVVFPPSEEEWLLDQVAAVQPRRRAGQVGTSMPPTFVLPGGELAVRISYRSQLVAVLVVDDERRRGSRRIREKAGREQTELKLSGARMARITEVATRVFATALKDTLVSDQQALAAESAASAALVRRDVLPFIGAAPPQPTGPALNATRFTEQRRDRLEAEEAAATALATANANASSASILSSDVTISVGGATNITFDLHLLEDFKHAFDDLQLSGLSFENNTNLFILKIAAPVVAALALEPLISLVDTYYVGHFLGSVSLSAYGLSERVFVFSLYILNFLATSTTPIVANLRAQGQDEAARNLVGRLLFFGAVFGFALIPILQTLSYPLLNLLGAVPENYVEAVEYFQVRSWGTPALMLMAVSNGALRGYLDTTTPLVVAAIAFVVDYSVDPEVIYPADPKGLGAAGAATVIAEWLSAGLFLTKFVTMKPPILPVLDLFPPGPRWPPWCRPRHKSSSAPCCCKRSWPRLALPRHASGPWTLPRTRSPSSFGCRLPSSPRPFPSPRKAWWPTPSAAAKRCGPGSSASCSSSGGWPSAGCWRSCTRRPKSSSRTCCPASSRRTKASWTRCTPSFG